MLRKLKNRRGELSWGSMMLIFFLVNTIAGETGRQLGWFGEKDGVRGKYFVDVAINDDTTRWWQQDKYTIQQLRPDHLTNVGRTDIIIPDQNFHAQFVDVYSIEYPHQEVKRFEWPSVASLRP